jgi:hypothetical protein
VVAWRRSSLATNRSASERTSSFRASSDWFGPCVNQDLEHVTDRAPAADRPLQRQLALDRVAVAAAIPTLVLHHVAGLGEVVDDAVDTALGDAELQGDVAQPHVGVMGDAHQCPCVNGEEAPVGHQAIIVSSF